MIWIIPELRNVGSENLVSEKQSVKKSHVNLSIFTKTVVFIYFFINVCGQLVGPKSVLPS